MMTDFSSNNLLLIGCGIFLIVLGCIAWRQPRAGNRVAYWHQTIPGLDETPDRFYAQVYQALKDSLQIRHIALTGFGFGPTHLFAGRHIFTERPIYLEARYGHLRYYLYVGQTPAGFFISTWLYSKYVVGDDKPTVLPAGFRYFARQSLFQYDATLMFNESVHSIVMEVLDRYIAEQELTPLTEAQRCPVMHAFYGRGLPPTAPLPPTASLPTVSARDSAGGTGIAPGAVGTNGVAGDNSSNGTQNAGGMGRAAGSEAVGAEAASPPTGDNTGAATVGATTVGTESIGAATADDGTVSGATTGRKLPLSS